MGRVKELKIPQADDVVKIGDLPLAVAEGVLTVGDVAVRYGFDTRQALYYLQAVEMLDLVKRQRDRYLLSRTGHRYVALTQPQRKELLCRKMLSLPVIAMLILELLLSPLHRLTRDDIEKMVSSRSGMSKTTVSRRVQSIFSWLTWLAEETGVFKVSQDSVSIMSSIPRSHC